MTGKTSTDSLKKATSTNSIQSPNDGQGGPAEYLACAIKTHHRKRGRPKGSKNKPKELPEFY